MRVTSYGVVLAGPKAGQADVDWSPVARALGLDQAAFAAKVLSAMPVLVRHQVDENLANEVAARLAAIGAVAEVVPDGGPFAYIERDGVSLGPVPHAALDRFIGDGERYRLRNTREWQIWHEAVALVPAEDAEPAVQPGVAAGDVAAAPDVAVTFEPPPPPPVDASAFPPAWTQPIVEDEAPMPPVDATPERSSLAAVAGYLGVFSIVPLIGLLAMAVGMLAVRDIRRHPHKQGIGRARFAIAIGAVLSVVWAALFVLRDDLRLPPTSQVNEVTAGQLMVDRQAPVRAGKADEAPVAAPGTVTSASPASAASVPVASTFSAAPTDTSRSPAAASSAASPASGASVATTPASAAPVIPVASAHADPVRLADESTGPSFDCRKSLTMAETVICASKPLSALDREQAAAFNKALAQVSGEKATSLRESQAAWQHERNDLCGSDGKCVERYMRARLVTFAPPPKKSVAVASP
jgi:uncharacterized protein YecT (DUF1311 family)